MLSIEDKTIKTSGELSLIRDEWFALTTYLINRYGISIEEIIVNLRISQNVKVNIKEIES